MPDEKRKYERLNMTDGVNSKDSIVIEGKNISLGGICIIMGTEMNVDSVIDMEFHLPGNSNKFTAKAKVIWQEKTDKGYKTGLEFTNISVVR